MSRPRADFHFQSGSPTEAEFKDPGCRVGQFAVVVVVQNFRVMVAVPEGTWTLWHTCLQMHCRNGFDEYRSLPTAFANFRLAWANFLAAQRPPHLHRLPRDGAKACMMLSNMPLPSEHWCSQGCSSGPSKSCNAHLGQWTGRSER